MGVDPGTRGAVAVLSGAGYPLHVQAFNPHMTQKQLVACVGYAAHILRHHGGSECWIEKVGYMPGDGGKGANTFGRVDGILRGAVLAFGLTLHDAPPVLWQARLGCMSGGNKNVTKNRAIQIFTQRGANVKITHAVADSMLIAEFGRQLMMDRRGL